MSHGPGLLLTTYVRSLVPRPLTSWGLGNQLLDVYKGQEIKVLTLVLNLFILSIARILNLA